MNLEKYQHRLVAEEQKLSARVERAMAAGRQSGDGAPHDLADDSSSDELKDEGFAEAEGDRMVLNQVREALNRIADGTFGTCVVDGGPIPCRFQSRAHARSSTTPRAIGRCYSDRPVGNSGRLSAIGGCCLRKGTV